MTVHQRLWRPGPLRCCRRLRRSNRAKCAYNANPNRAGFTEPVHGHKRLRRSERTGFDVKIVPLKGRNPCLSFDFEVCLRRIWLGHCDRSSASLFSGPLRCCRRLRRSNRAECAYNANPNRAGFTKPVRGHKRLRRSERTEFDVKTDPFKGRNPCLSFHLRSLPSPNLVRSV